MKRRRRALTCWFYRGLVILLLAISCEGVPSSAPHYRIARDPTWTPLGSVGHERGLLPFSDELLRAIAQEEHFTLSFLTVNGLQLGDVLRFNKADAILTAMPPLPVFRPLYDFSTPYLYVGPVLVVRCGSPIKSLDQMAGGEVAIPLDSRMRLLAAQIPHVVIRSYLSNVLALNALDQGRADGALIEALTAYAYVRDLYEGQLCVTTPPLTEDGLRLVTLKGEEEEFQERFQKGLKKVIENGTYAALAKKWGLDLREGPQRTLVFKEADPYLYLPSSQVAKALTFSSDD